MDEILIRVTPHDTCVAVLRNHALFSLYTANARAQSLVGNIYQGRVLKVLPGMQAAFIDLGFQPAGFLPLKALGGCSPLVTTEGKSPVIQDYLVDGQAVMVQVVKDPIGNKGFQLSTMITLAGRYVIYRPYEVISKVSIPGSIADSAERMRLIDLMEAIVGDADQRYLMRSAAVGVTARALQEDIAYLQQRWHDIQAMRTQCQPRNCIAAELSLPLRALRDLVTSDTAHVLVDCHKTFVTLGDFAQRYMPEILPKIDYYADLTPIFDRDNVAFDIQRAMQRSVTLPSGGAVVFDTTEAMTTIDVNTATAVGVHRQGETMRQTNLEAASEIARQFRIRNTSGMIVIDFINMIDKTHRVQVREALRLALSEDPIETTIGDFSASGLLEVTRKRMQGTLSQHTQMPCIVCHGQGYMPRPETICHDIVKMVLRYAAEADHPVGYHILADKTVVDCFLDPTLGLREMVEDKIQHALTIEVSSFCNREKFEITPMVRHA